MMNAERMKKAGVDYEAGLKRFMDDPELYEAVLTAFADEDILERAQAAFDKRDYTKLEMAVHEAKGAGGNAGLDMIYAEAAAVVSLLRAGSYTEDELIADFSRFEKVYAEIRDGIRAALSQS